MTTLVVLAVTLTLGAVTGPSSAERVSAPPPSSAQRGIGKVKIRIKVGDRVFAATLLDSPAARDFASLLPLKIKMKDLFGREKYGHLPRAISEEGQRERRYEVGQIAYWPPGPDVAVYYRQDGESIPDPGIVVLGSIDGAEPLAFSGSADVTFEHAEFVNRGHEETKP